MNQVPDTRGSECFGELRGLDRRPPAHVRQAQAFTLVEILIALFLVALLAAAAFSSMGYVARTVTGNLYHSEAHRLAQQRLEALKAADFASFIASGDEIIDSAIDSDFTTSSLARFVYPDIAASRRAQFTRDVQLVSDIGATPYRHLEVRVRWTFLGREHSLSFHTCRAQ